VLPSRNEFPAFQGLAGRPEVVLRPEASASAIGPEADEDQKGEDDRETPGVGCSSVNGTAHEGKPAKTIRFTMQPMEVYYSMLNLE
jgi:hypothetical protein